MKRVGFSLVLCRYIDMDVEATIGHFNLIIGKLPKLAY